MAFGHFAKEQNSPSTKVLSEDQWKAWLDRERHLKGSPKPLPIPKKDEEDYSSIEDYNNKKGKFQPWLK